MNRLRFFQLRIIKTVNRLLVLLLAALFLIATQGNIGFLWMQSYYYVNTLKDKFVTKTIGLNSPFLAAERLGNSIGDYTYYVSGMVDPEFDCEIGGEKSKDATYIWNTCIEAGINPAAAAGIINNYFGEGHVWQYNGAYAGTSGAKEWCLEQIARFNSGQMTPEEFKATKYSGGASTAFGAWQWLSGRKLNLAKSARNADMDIGSLELQINFVLCEIGIKDNLSDYEIRGSKDRWKDYVGEETMTPTGYAEHFACYFEGYQGTANIEHYRKGVKGPVGSNESHVASAQKIYDAFMAAADAYAALHNSVGSSIYNGNILPIDFAVTHNIDTSKMTEKRWELIERAYYWCDYGSGDYILYSKTDDGRHWQDYDNCVRNKTRGQLDCSKFVEELYKSIGINDVPGSTQSDYAKNGFMQIDSADLVAGDIVAYRGSGHGHVQIFLGWIDPNDHSKGYHKASSSTWDTTAPRQVLVSTEKKPIVNTAGYGDGNYRAYRHRSLPIGNGVASQSTGRVNITQTSGNVLLIGDSRTEGMCIAAGLSPKEFGSFTAGKSHMKKCTKDKMTIICCVGAGYKLLEDTDVRQYTEAACNNKDTIVIALGVNDRNLQKYYSIISGLASRTKVYWCTSGPVVNRNDLSDSIKSFNSSIISNASAGKYSVLDYYSWVTALDYKNGISSDGLHYSTSVNKSLFNILCKECSK